MDGIKEAFNKVKEDIFSIRHEISLLREAISDLGKEIIYLKSVGINKTDSYKTETHPSTIQTNNKGFKPLKPQNYGFSIGNKGVPTDRQTDQQTDQQTDFNNKMPENPLENAIKILESLDAAKKELRLRFKRLTDQEFVVFSTLYQLEEENVPVITYKTISQKLSLTESSIRDYIGKLILKNIPIEKKKMNNKSISLKISQNLKNVASLSTILHLRDL